MFYLFRINLLIAVILYQAVSITTGVLGQSATTSSYGSKPSKSCKVTEWTCTVNSECIDFNHVCDNIPDCPDASDEGPQLCDQSFGEPSHGESDKNGFKGMATTASSLLKQRGANSRANLKVNRTNSSRTDQSLFRRDNVVKAADEPKHGEDGVPLSSIPEIVFMGWFPNRGRDPGSAGLIVREKGIETTTTAPIVTPRPPAVAASSALEALRALIKETPTRERINFQTPTPITTSATTTSMMFRNYPTSTPMPMRTAILTTKSHIKKCVLDDRHNDFCRRKYRGYFVDPDDCRKYIVCEWGYSHVCHCPNMTVWDARIMACVWEFQADPCGKNITPSTPKATTIAPTPSTTTSSRQQTMHPFFRALFSDAFKSGRLSPQFAFSASRPTPSNIERSPSRNDLFVKSSFSVDPSGSGIRGGNSPSWFRSPEVAGLPTPSTPRGSIGNIGVPMLSNFFETGIRAMFNNRNSGRNNGS